MNKLTVKEAAKMLGVSLITMRHMLKTLPEKIVFIKKSRHRTYFYINRNNFIEYFNIKNL
jgi:predicted DNA-binding transcriptional regulator YafY